MPRETNIFSRNPRMGKISKFFIEKNAYLRIPMP